MHFSVNSCASEERLCVGDDWHEIEKFFSDVIDWNALNHSSEAKRSPQPPFFPVSQLGPVECLDRGWFGGRVQYPRLLQNAVRNAQQQPRCTKLAQHFGEV